MATTSKFNEGDILTYTPHQGTSIRDVIFVAYKDADIAEVMYKGDGYRLPIAKMELQKPKVEIRRVFEEDASYVDA